MSFRVSEKFKFQYLFGFLCNNNEPFLDLLLTCDKSCCVLIRYHNTPRAFSHSNKILLSGWWITKEIIQRSFWKGVKPLKTFFERKYSYRVTLYRKNNPKKNLNLTGKSYPTYSPELSLRIATFFCLLTTGEA